jgi:Rrf2 family protein
MRRVNVTAKADYALRAAVELAAHREGPLTSEAIARNQDIPKAFLASILQELRRAGIVQSRRGADGGHWLVGAPEEVSVADVVRAVDGPLAGVAGRAPEDLQLDGPAASLPAVWVATRGALREVLESVTLADVASGQLPPSVQRRLDAPDAWERR